MFFFFLLCPKHIFHVFIFNLFDNFNVKSITKPKKKNVFFFCLRRNIHKNDAKNKNNQKAYVWFEPQSTEEKKS